jgi:hypothetical protein
VLIEIGVVFPEINIQNISVLIEFGVVSTLINIQYSTDENGREVDLTSMEEFRLI